MKSNDFSRRRRQVLLKEIFRNALTIAVLKQAVMLASASSAGTVEPSSQTPVPPYFRG